MLGFVFFAAMALAGDYLSTRFGLPIPGPIIGLGMALCILLLRRRVDRPVKDAGDAFARALPLMLVPIGVAGTVRLVKSPPADVWKLLFVLILALIAGAIATAKIMQGAISLHKSRLSRPQAYGEDGAGSQGGKG
jgi:holin-like protein